MDSRRAIRRMRGSRGGVQNDPFAYVDSPRSLRCRGPAPAARNLRPRRSERRLCNRARRGGETAKAVVRVAGEARSRAVETIVSSRPSWLPSSSPTAVVPVCRAVDLEQAPTRPCVRRHAVPRTDVIVFDLRLPLRLAEWSPRRRELGRCRNSSIPTLTSPARTRAATPSGARRRTSVHACRVRWLSASELAAIRWLRPFASRRKPGNAADCRSAWVQRVALLWLNDSRPCRGCGGCLFQTSSVGRVDRRGRRCCR